MPLYVSLSLSVTTHTDDTHRARVHARVRLLLAPGFDLSASLFHMQMI